MSTQVNILTLKGIDKNIYGSFGEQPPLWSTLLHMRDTEYRYIDMVNWQDYNLPGFRQPGAPVAQGQFLPSFSVRMVIRNAGLGDAIAYEDIEDDLYGFVHRMLPKKGTAMGLAFQTLMEVSLANYMVLNGFTAGAIPGMVDGLSTFNTAHPVSLSNQTTTFSNRNDVDLSISSAQAAITAMETQQYENNIRYQNNRVAECWVNPALQFVAKQIFYQTGNQAFSADYTSNKFLSDKGVQVKEWPYFKSYGVNGAIANNPNSWFLKGQMHEGYFYWRQQFKNFTDFDMTTLSQLFVATSRFGYVIANPRGWYGSLGA
jgi:hypothetical protein